MSEWTPAPWRIEETADWRDESGGEGFRLVGPGKQIVQSFGDEYYVVCANPADARLIAAAPEMAELLESIDRWGMASAEAVDRARKLLERIKGTNP